MAGKNGSRRKIRVGVVGVSRGETFAHTAQFTGMELVAVCDRWEERLKTAGKKYNVATYTDYDKFLEHNMDAVVLANFFHEHTPFAIKALRSGKHVMSETTACMTLGEGVALVREVEKSGKIYLLAENYPKMVFNQEMRRLYKSGLVGSFQYGEGEYVHPMSARQILRLSPGQNHWRNWIPGTYYCTHALAPLMYITETMPKRVNGFIIPVNDEDKVMRQTTRRCDPASMIALRMDNGAVVKLLQVMLRGEGIWVRVHGTQGAMENLRHGNWMMLRVRRDEFDKKTGEPAERIYTPDFPHHHEQAVRSGHGGGDFFMLYDFAEAIRKKEQPFFDVHKGVAMSAVGILAYKSALNDSASFEIPDFTKESERRKYANDNWTVDPAQRTKDQPWPSIRGNIQPTAEGLKLAEKVWHEMGYKGK